MLSMWTVSLPLFKAITLTEIECAVVISNKRLIYEVDGMVGFFSILKQGLWLRELRKARKSYNCL